MKLVFFISILLISCMVRDALLTAPAGGRAGVDNVDGRSPGIDRIRREVRRPPEGPSA